ncbi:hypothetical protein [Alloscardovia criceti]|uniref:hypothetical protein n=1 Tax=Alloscardovia criceti TaxID=356828 RepID=UPI0003745699|nr:hypothetical protein [Alloscardovia criceti]
MAINFEEQIHAYEKQMQEQIKELKAKQQRFKAQHKKIAAFEAKLEDDLKKYMDVYEEINTSGITAAELRETGIDAPYATIRRIYQNLNAAKKENGMPTQQESNQETNQPTQTPVAEGNTATYQEENQNEDSNHDSVNQQEYAPQNNEYAPQQY